MGGILQPARIATECAQGMLRNLTNDRPRKILSVAMEDPEVFGTLAMQPEAWAPSQRADPRFGPYPRARERRRSGGRGGPAGRIDAPAEHPGGVAQ